MRRSRFALVLVLLVLLLLVAASAYSLPLLQIPVVPHPVEGREDCLECHDTDQVAAFPEDHEGRENDSCTMCHQAGEDVDMPPVPHPVEGREDCLECHDTDQAMPFPEDHEGRENDSCTLCHQAGAEETTPPAATPPAAMPPVPHPIEGREDCLECHGTGQAIPFPEDHEGRDNDSCTLCHEAGEAAATPTTAASPTVPPPTVTSPTAASPTDTPPAATSPTDAPPTTMPPTAAPPAALPSVPHSIEGREDCLQCHDSGQIVPFPADHEGRENDGCLGCHQVSETGATEPTPEPTPTLPPSVQVVPTPIHEPVLFEENTCISCHRELGGKHAEITADWEEGVHAAQGVGCVSCHGGDPTKEDAEESMSPEAGYLGPLPKDQIPGLCGSCHTRVDLMRPFDLPTDQLAQYWQSQHGQALLDGDENVATCFDCHDGHKVLKASDPGSQVYPSNEPAMCASCHADESLMAPYGIPTNQYDLYQISVHGQALLEDQNLRAPTCSTCHGTHGAAPPGYQQVANVCGQCHTATQDYYMEGAHRSGMTTEAAPRCVTCHGRYDVMPATRDLFVGTEERHCGSCHPPDSEIGGQVEAMHSALTEADEAYEQAEAAIALGTESRLIMAEQEELLQQANTPLIESRALQHNVNLDEVRAKAEESMMISQEAQASAEAALQQLDTRRLGMVIALAVIVVTIIALVLIKRQLDRDLEAERAARR